MQVPNSEFIYMHMQLILLQAKTPKLGISWQTNTEVRESLAYRTLTKDSFEPGISRILGGNI